MKRLLTLKIVRFSFVGALGFVVDALVLQLLASIFKMDLYLSQIIAFLAAASVTWHFNRTFTFRDRERFNKKRQWGLYVLFNTVGGAVNYGVYSLFIASFASTHKFPVLALAAGSVAGLAFNFFASRYVIFRNRAVPTALEN